MALSKIVLFYVFTPLADPEAVRLWQRELCTSLGLRGRILLSPQGINATVGGELRALKRYLRVTREYSAFAAADVKWGEGTGLDPETADARAPFGYSIDFPKLSVKVRNELVTFGASHELAVTRDGVIGGGERLTPDQLHTLIDERGDEVVLLDGRNAFEAEIGRFRDAVIPDASTTRDFIEVLESGELDAYKGRPVVTYCTGGIRCEVLSAMMRARGFGEVYQLDGGILRYGERFGSSGLWEGAVYVFDRRGSVEFGESAVPIGQCVVCATSTSRMQNCSDLSCRTQLVVCEHCCENPVLCDHHAALAG